MQDACVRRSRRAAAIDSIEGGRISFGYGGQRSLGGCFVANITKCASICLETAASLRWGHRRSSGTNENPAIGIFKGVFCSRFLGLMAPGVSDMCFEIRIMPHPEPQVVDATHTMASLGRDRCVWVIWLGRRFGGTFSSLGNYEPRIPS